MNDIKSIDISIHPEPIFGSDSTMYKCRIRVEVWGKPEYTIQAPIPDNDFISRFGWFMELAKKEIENQFEE